MRQWFKLTVPYFALFLALALIIDWRNGAFRSEFGRYPDEGMHYVTGLLIRDFLLSVNWAHPMQFALDFYAHFPKVAIGNWPPVFEILQAAWGMIFGVSRPALLGGMAVLAALLATAQFRAVSQRSTPLFAIAAAAALLLSPLTQSHTSMIMSEVPLALFSLLAIVAWVKFWESNTSRDAIVFGLWTTVAILTKGNAWVIPVTVAASILLSGQWKRLLRPAFWIPVAIIAGVCIPYTLLTMGIVVQGWNQRDLPSLAFLWASLAVHHGYIVAILGAPLYLLVWAGILNRLLLPLFRRSRVEPFWGIMGTYGAAILLFHAVVPTSIEPRKIYQVAPVLAIFLAAGLHAIRNGLARWLPSTFAAGAVLAAASAAFFWNGFLLLQPFAPGFAPAVSKLLIAPDSRGTAILVASNPVFNDSEAAVIAEWASRDRSSGTYLVRANKLLASPYEVEKNVVDFEPFDKTPQELALRLEAVPISYVLLHDTPAPRSYRHQALLRAVLEQAPETWERVYRVSQSVTLGQPHSIEIFRFRKNVQGVPIHLQIDLSNKLGIPATAGAPE